MRLDDNFRDVLWWWQVVLSVRLRISPRINQAASNFARCFMSVVGRESPILGNFEPQNLSIRPKWDICGCARVVCQNAEFKEHAIRFMQAIGVVVEHIDNYELRMSHLLRDLGRRHHTIILHWLIIHSFIRPSVCPSVRPSVRPSYCPSLCPSIHPSIHPFIHSFIHSFIWMYMEWKELDVTIASLENATSISRQNQSHAWKRPDIITS